MLATKLFTWQKGLEHEIRFCEVAIHTALYIQDKLHCTPLHLFNHQVGFFCHLLQLIPHQIVHGVHLERGTISSSWSASAKGVIVHHKDSLS